MSVDPSAQIERYTDRERMNHWLVAILFVLVALSGLSLFHPALFWLSNLFGGGPWTRILHPFLGVAAVAAFFFEMVRFWGDNRLQEHDRQWLRQWRDVLANREDKLPAMGRYNAGQKVLFWVMVVCMIVLLLTGVVFWRPWFADSFPVFLVRLATLVHAAVATILILGIIIHIYAAIWTKGSFRAMMRGTVSTRWAMKHHRAWAQEKIKQG